jgi:cytochrome P450
VNLFKAELKNTWAHKIPPGPSRFTFLRDVRRNPAKCFHELMLQYGDIVKCQGTFEVYLLNRPDYAKHVLQTNHKNYSKDNLILNRLKLALGKGLVTSEGELWFNQRRLMQPVFHKNCVVEFSTLITNSVLEMFDDWNYRFRNDIPLDVTRAMRKLSLKIVGKSLFNFDTKCLEEEIYKAANIGTKYMSDLSPLSLPYWFPSPGNLEFRNAINSVDKILLTMIDKHRDQDTRKDDLLSLLQSAKSNESGYRVDDQQILDEVKTFLMAGHENTANVLTWIWILLSKHPGVRRLVEEELAEVLGGRLPTVEDIPNLVYTRMVFEEAMRLYPPVWIITRRALTDDQIDEYPIPVNIIVIVSPYVLHRHPDFWKNPDIFDPTRFSEENSKGRPPYAYIPFGGGPRRCIGDHFATMEVQLIIATLAQHFHLALPHDSQIEIHPFVSLRPPEGLLMKIHKAQLN